MLKLHSIDRKKLKKKDQMSMVETHSEGGIYSHRRQMEEN